jgi:transcription elongation factor GreA
VPIGTQRAWLTEETSGRARIELAELLILRAIGSFVECKGEERCARRIRGLQGLFGDAVVGYMPPEDGNAEPGMVLTVRYNADELNARFLMAREEVAEDDLPQSPLGTALNRAKAGDRRNLSICGGNAL